MKNDRSSPGPALYAAVMIILAGYFGWILDRMAAFSQNGFARLDKLLIGFGLVLITLLVVGGIEAFSRHRRARRRAAQH